MTTHNEFPNEKKTWIDLLEEAKKFRQKSTHTDVKLNNNFVLKKCGLTLDFSRQNINTKILKKLIGLAQECDLSKKISDFSNLKLSNSHNNLNALHLALRDKKNFTKLSNENAANEVHKELKKFLEFAEKLRAFAIFGWKNIPIKSVVVLGLGGSIMGPKLATKALEPNKTLDQINLFFISNPDCIEFNYLLETLNAKETFFIVQSKSLKTPEISILRDRAYEWMRIQGCPDSYLKKHFAVVTANLNKSKSEGYLSSHTFRIWEWVGGRFSIWSSMGLPLAIAIGSKKFRDFLNGAKEMDDHFVTEQFSTNLPIMSALLSIWNRNFLDYPSYVVVPYTSKLDLLVNYIQQLDMESLGKNVHTNGKPCKINTGQIVWGGPGIQGQHAYFQLLHQGKHVVPVDFYGVNKTSKKGKIENTQSTFMYSSLKAQADSLFFGDTCDNFEGQRPSSVLLLDKISPKILGALLSMQEHRVFVMAAIWNINAFDQPGVELGKKLLTKNLEG